MPRSMLGRGMGWWAVALALMVMAVPMTAAAQSSSSSVNDIHNAVDNAISSVCSSPYAKGPNLALLCSKITLGSFSDFLSIPNPATILTGITGISTSGGRPSFMPGLNSPVTPSGSAGQLDGDAQGGRKDFGRLGVFGTFDFEHLDKKETRFEDGIEAQTYGGTVGADFRVLPWLVAGGAFTVKGTRGTFDENSGDFDVMGYGLTLYATMTPLPNLFVDVIVGGALKDYGYQRNVINAGLGTAGLVNGDTDGREARITVGGGYDFVYQAVTIGPRLSINYVHNTVDEFVERGRTGTELAFDEQHHSSLTLRAGVVGTWAASTPFGVLLSQGSVEYIHEFMDDQRVVYFRLAEDAGQARFRFLNDPPDRNYWQLGVGFALQLPKGITPYVGYQALVGYKRYSVHSLAAGLRVSF